VLKVNQNESTLSQNVTLLDILDGVLDKGVVLAGGLTISVADIDLVYVDLRLLITSVESMLNGKHFNEF
jgi:gas vesicle structural protein